MLIYYRVGVACGVVADVHTMWLVQCAASAQARCQCTLLRRQHIGVDLQTLAASRRNGAATIIVVSGVSVYFGVPNDIAYECFTLCSLFVNMK